MELELLTDALQEHCRTHIWNDIDPRMDYRDWDVLSRNVEILVNIDIREITMPVYADLQERAVRESFRRR